MGQSLGKNVAESAKEKDFTLIKLFLRPNDIRPVRRNTNFIDLY
jgi:hypothetical protein